THPSGARATLPLWLERGDEGPTTPPGASEPAVIPLLAGLSDEDRYVPAGWCILGGDPLAIDALPRTRVWVDGFVMKRHPVTNGEYLAFLRDVDRPDLVPGALDRAAPVRPWRRSTTWDLPEDEPHHHAASPVTLVDLPSALAYIAWRSRREGVDWRLPTAAEREKAARGADGRRWPWGDHHEPGWSRMIGTRSTPTIARIDEHEDDVCIYGIHGLAGNVRDWTSTLWPGEPDLHIVKGGAWSSVEAMCRPATRLANRPSDRFHNCGLRIVRSTFR
ncbi:MAG: SUMF1/EgtB/PvdO family nonheme iron enzyme, partial [Myxococcales bacterium]|nr:SUMF1/EgtB/PvdO family nonheme iron enzyme [Myxococcales bacterium]